MPFVASNFPLSACDTRSEVRLRKVRRAVGVIGLAVGVAAGAVDRWGVGILTAFGGFGWRNIAVAGRGSRESRRCCHIAGDRGKVVVKLSHCANVSSTFSRHWQLLGGAV